MGRMILLALALASCTPRQQLERGAYVPAPTARPGVGAPVVGQPGRVRPDVDYPRSPHKRVLPPTAGPGIWAGDEPKADVIALLADLPIYSSGQERVDIVLRGCAVGLESALGHARLLPRLLDVGHDAHLCAVASMMLQCAYMLDESEKSKRTPDKVLLARYLATVKYLEPLAAMACRDGRNDIVRDILSAWSAAFTPSGPPGRMQ